MSKLLDTKTEMASYVDGPASHLALLKLLLKRGVINDTDLELYREIRLEAMRHVTTISSVLAMALLVHEKDADEEEFREILGEMSIDLDGIEDRCREALDYMIMSDEQRQQVLTIIDALPHLRDAAEGDGS
jgi:hypothetical protein